ncbi:hypothetical protein TESG_04886 [Trichophyton tonsurans CBS 112818]|uniref:Uncharacterized protein n=1 Tax=Trichophyton tonsurans (strain CBS 112818) TaxID=647933 RepID=F2S1M9_TRIT1|nr:hypothetical protein TESG_04886 [Trichophyton tonsurans CBS 112818]
MELQLAASNGESCLVATKIPTSSTPTTPAKLPVFCSPTARRQQGNTRRFYRLPCVPVRVFRPNIFGSIRAKSLSGGVHKLLIPSYLPAASSTCISKASFHSAAAGRKIFIFLN